MNTFARRARLVVALFLVVATCPSPARSEERVIYAVSIIRHGDRTPYSAPGKNVRAVWPTRPGELTATGMRQVFDLGQSYRRRYVDELRLLPARYDPATLKVVSTPMNRTVMSAECLLAGLYPPGTGPRLPDDQPALPAGLQVVPVYTTDVTNPINPAMQPDGEVRRLLQAALRSPELLRLQAARQADLERWQALIGTHFGTLGDLFETADYLNCMLAHDLPLPAGLTRDEARRIVDLGFEVLADLYNRPEIRRAMTHELLSGLVTSMRQATHDDLQGRRLTIYSGHDVTILAVLAALGHPLPTNPPYAAHIELELVRADDGAYKVRLRYNDRSLPLGGQVEVPLDRFESVMDRSP